MSIRLLCRTLSLLPYGFCGLSFVKFYSHYANLSTCHTILKIYYHNILFIVVAMRMIEQRLCVGHSNCSVMMKIIRAQDPGFSHKSWSLLTNNLSISSRTKVDEDMSKTPSKEIDFQVGCPPMLENGRWLPSG